MSICAHDYGVGENRLSQIIENKKPQEKMIKEAHQKDKIKATVHIKINNTGKLK